MFSLLGFSKAFFLVVGLDAASSAILDDNTGECSICLSPVLHPDYENQNPSCKDNHKVCHGCEKNFLPTRGFLLAPSECPPKKECPLCLYQKCRNGLEESESAESEKKPLLRKIPEQDQASSQPHLLSKKNDQVRILDLGLDPKWEPVRPEEMKTVPKFDAVFLAKFPRKAKELAKETKQLPVYPSEQDLLAPLGEDFARWVPLSTEQKKESSMTVLQGLVDEKIKSFSDLVKSWQATFRQRLLQPGTEEIGTTSPDYVELRSHASLPTHDYLSASWSVTDEFSYNVLGLPEAFQRTQKRPSYVQMSTCNQNEFDQEVLLLHVDGASHSQSPVKTMLKIAMTLDLVLDHQELQADKQRQGWTMDIAKTGTRYVTSASRNPLNYEEPPSVFGYGELEQSLSAIEREWEKLSKGAQEKPQEHYTPVRHAVAWLVMDQGFQKQLHTEGSALSALLTESEKTTLRKVNSLVHSSPKTYAKRLFVTVTYDLNTAEEVAEAIKWLEEGPSAV